MWKARERATGQLLGWECGRRDAATVKTLIERLAPGDVAFYGTDHWKTSASVLPAETLVKSKAKTDGIERHHGQQRHWCGRFKRQAMVVSTSQEMGDLAMALLARFRVNGSVSAIFTLKMITSTTLSDFVRAG